METSPKTKAWRDHTSDLSVHPLSLEVQPTLKKAIWGGRPETHSLEQECFAGRILGTHVSFVDFLCGPQIRFKIKTLGGHKFFLLSERGKIIS